MARRTELSNQILSATPLCKDVAGIISKLVPDVRSIIEQMIFTILTKGGDTRYNYNDYKLSEVKSLSEYINANEEYLLNIINDNYLDFCEYADAHIRWNLNQYNCDKLELKYGDECFLDSGYYGTMNTIMKMFPIMESFHQDSKNDIREIFSKWIVNTFGNYKL